MRFVRPFLVIALALAVGGWLYAQSASAPVAGSASPKKDAKSKQLIAITPEREAAALTFVQRNHAELADLLAALKTNDPQQYDRAIRDIYRVTERLALIQERDPLQYELEIAAWTAQSRVELLAARLKMGSSDELIKLLREALKTQSDAKLALLKHERQKAADRLAKVEADIARLGDGRDETIERQLKVLVRTAGEGRPAKSGTKPKKISTTNP